MKDIRGEHIQCLKDTFRRYFPVSDKSVSLLESIAKIQQIKKKELLVPIGKTSRYIHILYKGAMVSHFIGTEGDTYHKNIFLEGNLVGSMVSSLKNEPSDFALEAIEDCELISFDYRKYRQLIDENADLKSFYIAYLEKNWVIDKEKREIEIILKDAGTRYHDFITQYPGIDMRIPLRYIASHLGITPTQLSRIRKEIKKNFPIQHM